ncbi:MAG: DUF58 domain-containing protein [Clostridia bacterium]|nr:DUF58 domain-containing protein [Clostridia bacterium]
MTIRGIICVLVELLFLTVALGTGIRELLVVAVCLGAALLYSVISILFAQLTLSASVDIDKSELCRGEALNYTLHIKGIVILPVTAFLTIAPPGAKRRERNKRRRHAFSLSPSLFVNREYDFSLECEHRGYFKAGLSSLRLRDLFGIISLPLIRSLKTPYKLPITVFPTIHKIHNADEKTSTSEGFATTQIKSAERGELLGDTRLYMQGDSLKRIHWKQSARTRQLHTRQFEVQENPQVLIVLDAACREDDTGSIADIATETAISLAKYYSNNNKSVRFITVRNKSYAENEDLWIKNDRDVYVLLHKLVGITFYKDEDTLDLWQLRDVDFKSTSTVRVISNNPSIELLNTLEEIVSRNGLASCFVTQTVEEITPAVERALASNGARTVILNSCKDIGVKVGAVL